MINGHKGIAGDEQRLITTKCAFFWTSGEHFECLQHKERIKLAQPAKHLPDLQSLCKRSWAWWGTPVILALRRRTPEDAWSSLVSLPNPLGELQVKGRSLSQNQDGSTPKANIWPLHMHAPYVHVCSPAPLHTCAYTNMHTYTQKK